MVAILQLQSLLQKCTMAKVQSIQSSYSKEVRQLLKLKVELAEKAYRDMLLLECVENELKDITIRV